MAKATRRPAGRRSAPTQTGSGPARPDHRRIDGAARRALVWRHRARRHRRGRGRPPRRSSRNLRRQAGDPCRLRPADRPRGAGRRRAGSVARAARPAVRGGDAPFRCARALQGGLWPASPVRRGATRRSPASSMASPSARRNGRWPPPASDHGGLAGKAMVEGAVLVHLDALRTWLRDDDEDHGPHHGDARPGASPGRAGDARARRHLLLRRRGSWSGGGRCATPAAVAAPAGEEA